MASEVHVGQEVAVVERDVITGQHVTEPREVGFAFAVAIQDVVSERGAIQVASGGRPACGPYPHAEPVSRADSVEFNGHREIHAVTKAREDGH